MNNEEHFKKLIFSRKRRKGSDKIGVILKEWYGEENGERELISYLPKPIPIKDVVQNLINNVFNPSDYKLTELKKDWESIVGAHVAKISRPTSIKNKILTIEVESSSWLMELKNFHFKLMENKIKTFCGENFCSKIVLMLKGR